MRRIIAQARKELTQLLRDPLALGLALVLPVGLTALMGTTVSLTVTDIPIVIQDFDQTPLSRQYADAFRTSLTYRVVTLPPATSPETMLARGRARAAVIIPQHFEREIRRHRPVQAQVLVDATDGNTAQLIRGSAGQITLAFARPLAGDPTPVIVGRVLFVFCVMSFGSLVGAAIPNQAAAVQAVALGGFLLSFLLSGLIFPIENIPGTLRWISNFVQARYYVVIVRDAFLQGGGWPAVWWAVLAIGAIGLVFYGLAWRAMRRMQVKA